jgi:hypothetical protein
MQVIFTERRSSVTAVSLAWRCDVTPLGARCAEQVARMAAQPVTLAASWTV